MRGRLCLVLLLVLQGGTGGTWGGQPHQESPDAESTKELSIVKRGVGDPYSRRSALDKNFIRFGRSSSFFEKPDPKTHKNVMSYSRVSRAANDNFMRFGRPDPEIQQLYFEPTAESSPPASRRGDNFMRFGRAKDNFMRFGRAKDNFMRFGRPKDNFMRFGRAKDNFMRFGRAKDNFMRFGRDKDNFMRFGKARNLLRFGRKDNFMRFGRSWSDDDKNKRSDVKGFVRLSKSPKSEEAFIRFGRSEVDDPEEPKIDDGGPEEELGDLDLQADKPKHGPVIRIKRSSEPTSLWEVEEASMNRSTRDPELMEELPTLTKDGKIKKRFTHSEDEDQEGFDGDYIPVQIFHDSDYDLEGKRTDSGSSFIRFG